MSLKRLSVLVLGVLMISSGIVCAAHDRNPHHGGDGGTGIAGTWDYDPDQKVGEKLLMSSGR